MAKRKPKREKQESHGVSLPPALWRAVEAWQRRAPSTSPAFQNRNQAAADLIRRGLTTVPLSGEEQS